MRFAPISVFAVGIAATVVATAFLRIDRPWKPVGPWSDITVSMPAYSFFLGERDPSRTPIRSVSFTRAWIHRDWSGKTDARELFSEPGLRAPSPQEMVDRLEPDPTDPGAAVDYEALWQDPENQKSPPGLPRRAYAPTGLAVLRHYRVREETRQQAGILGIPYVVRRLHAVQAEPDRYQAAFTTFTFQGRPSTR